YSYNQIFTHDHFCPYTKILRNFLSGIYAHRRINVNTAVSNSMSKVSLFPEGTEILQDIDTLHFPV
ncbi:MAG: hypothetical protein ACTSQ9_07225, partial [Candidatus Hodarchaeales archaeon]